MFVHLFFVFYNLLVTKDYCQFFAFDSCYLYGASRSEFDVVICFFRALKFSRTTADNRAIWWEFGKTLLWRRNCKSTYLQNSRSFCKNNSVFFGLKSEQHQISLVMSMLYRTH